jgi:hypothetical protein
MALGFRWSSVLFFLACNSVHATGLEATLDQSNIVINMAPPTVLQVTLRNTGADPVYITGAGLLFSDGIEGAINDPALLQDKLRMLNPGESWGGGLVVIRPSHRGPLLVKGSITLKGGETPKSVDVLATVPLTLTINDPRRALDGSYDPSAVPTCDREGIYIAEGYKRQNLCVNQTADKTYDRVFDLQVSSDGTRIAYLAGTHCLSGGPEVRCARTVVIDHREQPVLDVPSHLQLSPDGLHYAYTGRTLCVWRSNVEDCSGPPHPIVDGVRAAAFPAWYRVLSKTQAL